MPLLTPSERLLDTLRPAQRALIDRMPIYTIEHADDPLFDLAYQGLHEHFGAEGQIEERDVLARIVSAPIEHDGIRVAHPLLVMLDEDGGLAAASGRYVTYEPTAGLVAGLDGSGFVAEPYRRLGIASISMPLLLDAGRHRLGATDEVQPLTLLDVGDLGMVRADDWISIGRAVVWGKSGCAAIPPSVFPLTLVGMKNQEAPDEVAPPVPILAVLRGTNGSASQPASVPRASLHALARHLQAAHSWAAEGAGLETETARLHAAIEAAPEDPVALLPLPTSLEDADRFQALFDLVHPLQRAHGGCAVGR